MVGLKVFDTPKRLSRLGMNWAEPPQIYRAEELLFEAEAPKIG